MSTKFILLINLKMPTMVGILTFISMINTISERLTARRFIILRYFSFYEHLKFRAHLSRARNMLYNLGALSCVCIECSHKHMTSSPLGYIQMARLKEAFFAYAISTEILSEGQYTVKPVLSSHLKWTKQRSSWKMVA